MRKILPYLFIVGISMSVSRLSAQTESIKPMDVFISSQMQMQMLGSSVASFDISANSKEKGIIEKSGAVQINVQTNRNWVLQVKPLEENFINSSNSESIPSEALRIRANGNPFIPLNYSGIDLVKGNKGSYQSIGNKIYIDYEFSFKKEQIPGNQQITLLYTLTAI